MVGLCGRQLWDDGMDKKLHRGLQIKCTHGDWARMKPDLCSADISPLKTDLLLYVGDKIEPSAGERLKLFERVLGSIPRFQTLLDKVKLPLLELRVSAASGWGSNQATCHVRLLFWKLRPCWFSVEDCKQRNGYITGHLSSNGECKSCCCAELVPSARLRFGSASSASLSYRSPSSASYPLGIPCITAGARNRWQNNVFKGITLQLMASLRERASVI